MSLHLVAGLIGIFGFAAIFNTFAIRLATTTHTQFRIKLSDFEPNTQATKQLRITLNGAFSVSMYSAFVYLAGDYFLQTNPSSVVEVILQVLMILLLWDFLYYCLHRAFHLPFLMKYVHGRHHHVRNPTAMDGLYLNPLDNLGGLGLLFVSVLIVGPISLSSFLIAVLLHTLINSITHTGLNLPHRAFRISNFWATKHAIHHGRNVNANYGVILPIWDLLFRSYE